MSDRNSRWRQLSRLCHDALQISPADRPEFLRHACAGDDALLHEAESLLANDAGAREFLNDNPSDLIGRQIGAYRVTSLLGIGGMGEVYRARDTKLGRDVAIKVLPAAFLTNPERVARFRREAQLLASLNHPQIGAIHSLEDAADPPALILELVEGETLAERLEKGPLAIGEALNIARQLGDALDAAHERGIVHRDLKPANIKITPKGCVKVLDFGLARSAVANDLASQSLTRHSEGRILGTPAYMSPEQARGKAVDTRADIWAFGCILFEMLTGRPAFAGDTATDTIADVLHRDPEWTQLPTAMAGSVRKLVQRCLEKDPARRLPDIGDAIAALSGGTVQPPRAQRSRRVRNILFAAGAFAIFGLVLTTRSGTPRDRPQPANPVRSSRPVTTYAGLEYDPSFSPDGTQIAFAWNGPQQDNWDIYLKVVGSAEEPLRLTRDGASDRFPAWSPKTREIAFARGKHIMLISALGGLERKLTDLEASSQLSWSPNGDWIAATEAGEEGRAGGISLISRESGAVRRMTLRHLPVEDRSPAFSPDGKWLAFGSCNTNYYECDVYALEVGTTSVPNANIQRLTRQGMVLGGLAWMPDSNTIVYSAGLPGPGNSRLNYKLWRTGLSRAGDSEQFSLAGNPAMLALSPDGHRLVYADTQSNTEIWSLDKGRPRQHPLSGTGGENSPAFSADGTRIAFVSNRTGNAEIFAANADGSHLMQLTSSGNEVCGSPRWSPNGEQIVYDRLTKDTLRHVFVINSDGTHARRLMDDPSADRVPSWSHDGRFIYFASNRSAGKDDIYRIAPDGREAERVTDRGGYVALESFDGKTLYYLKNPTGSSPLFARDFPNGPERQVLDFVNGRAFQVLKDGIHYIGKAATDGRFPLRILDLSSGADRLVTWLTPDLNGGLAVSPDGVHAIYVVNTPRKADLQLVEQFQ